jgi:hypothetical protein
MTYRKVPTVSFLIVFLSLFFTSGGYSQCLYEFKVASKIESGGGTIEVEVKAKSAFTVELYSDHGLERKVIQAKKGSGNEKIVFNGLSTGEIIYRVAVVVPTESNFLCKKKMSEEIFFNRN